MNISARLGGSSDTLKVDLDTAGNQKSLSLPPKPSGGGAAVNGGEMLLLALATCYYNDLYREAVRRNLQIDRVEVTVNGVFGGEGEPAQHISYGVRITADRHGEADIDDLIRHVDRVAEIHNTLRQGISVSLEPLRH
ncbi:putative OsmC-like protein [Neolewinella xylanilytica]|uniref:Putative OsmC-like protein n=1 Tax=Neolewinella xylanilytica TaxID=1514080 RepID=A0A2S6I7G6_9BACT|nr:OsmC family protein [Neolewinella xylanilytica]PPK87398.1 putative OsmC-like protein [Neolewinella xylanilytica]